MEKNRDNSPAEGSNAKKPYNAPSLVEHGSIGEVVENNTGTGADGGDPFDSAS